jgi:CelD/BcsL family acetyltransferase involved in cellulose biosynthesis
MVETVNLAPSATLTVTEATLEELTPSWSDLLARAGNRWPFLQPAWLNIWHRLLSPESELLLLAVWDGSELAGLMPLLINGDDLMLAGDPEICDYMDLPALPGRHAAVLDAGIRHLQQRPWQRIVLWGLRADSPTLKALGELGFEDISLSLEQEAVCPRVTLPTSWDEYLLTLSKKDRHELRRKIRRMTQSGDTAREYGLSTSVEVEAAMPDFLWLHRESRPDKAAFMTSGMERFFTEMAVALAGEDLVRLYFLELDERRVAGLLTFNCGDELWLYNSGFDPAFASASVGLVSKAIVLRQAIEDGKHCYDFLRGAEPYKYDLGASDLQVLRAVLTRAEASIEAAKGT